jgi:hypothetical protein
MFYSRPSIEPLGWDLAEFQPNGTFAFVGTTTDNRPVDIKYRNGWIQVWSGKPGAPSTDEDVLVAKIGPPYHGCMLPEQVCDVLGLTIKGQKPALSEERRLEAAEHESILDWSGRTTYWESFHHMFNDDVKLFIDDIMKAFPRSCLIQSEWFGGHKKRRYRQISFYLNSDNDLTIGIGYDKQRLEKMLSAEHVTMRESNEVFLHKIDLRCMGRLNARTKSFIDSYGADKLDLKYQLMCPRTFDLWTHFLTKDEGERAFMNELLSIINKHFFKRYQIIDLQTRSVLKVRESDDVSYSISQRDWCLGDQNRYLAVGVETPETRSYKRAEMLADGNKTIFYGLRPL